MLLASGLTPAAHITALVDLLPPDSRSPAMQGVVLRSVMSQVRRVQTMGDDDQGRTSANNLISIMFLLLDAMRRCNAGSP